MLTTTRRGARLSSSSVSPVVVDANYLRGEVLRLVRKPGPTILVSNARAGYILLFCARHVLDEVNRHLESWALDAGLDPLAAVARWREHFVPVLRVIDVPQGLLTEAETIRLLELCTDVDDWPTATLAMLLCAPLFSADKRPLRAVYGAQIDHLVHERECSAVLREVGDLGLLAGLMRAGAAVANLAGTGVVNGLSAVKLRVPLRVLVGIAGVAVVAVGVLPPERRRRALRTAALVSEAVMNVATAIAEVRAQARKALETLTPPGCAPDQVRDELNDDQLVARAALFVLAWGPTSQRELDELSISVADLVQLPASPDILARLRGSEGVVRVDEGLVTLGVHVEA